MTTAAFATGVALESRFKQVYDLTVAGTLPIKFIGPSDDMQAKLDAYGAAGGALVFLTPGSYSPVAIAANYDNLALIAQRGTVTFTQTANQKMFTISGRTNIRFEGIKFALGAFTTVGSYGIFGDTVTNCTIQSCEFSGGAVGCEIRNYTNLKFLDCFGTGAGQFAMVANGGTGVWFMRNKVTLGALAGIKVGTINTLRTGTLNLTNGSTAVTGNGTLFSTECTVGGYILANSISARITAIADDTHMTIVAWTGASTGGTPIGFFADTQTTNTDVFIIGNEPYSNTGDGINVDSSSAQNVLIANNICRSNIGYAIQVKQVYDGTGATWDQILITENVTTNNVAGPINCQRNDSGATVTNWTISGNRSSFSNGAQGIRLSSLTNVVVVDNDINSSSVGSMGVRLIDCSNCIVTDNRGKVAYGVVFDLQAATHVNNANYVEENRFECNTTTTNGVWFTDQNSGAWLANHTNNVVRDNELIGFSFSCIDTSTVGTKYYANKIGDVASAAPSQYAHIGDVMLNRTPQTADGGVFVEKYVAVTTANPATWKKVALS